MQDIVPEKIERESLRRIAVEVLEHIPPRRHEELDRWLRRLREERFHLALVGEFNRGKSTLGNALIGAEVLPAAVVPTTALPTFARHAATPAARIHRTDGSVVESDPSRIADFVSERENPGNRKGARFVEVWLPAEFLREVDLLDTPGVGSAHRHNTETALAALGEVDAAVVVLAADQPVSQGEIDLLASMKPRVTRFFFALNRTDLLSERELAESLEFTARVLGAHGFSPADLFPVSARAALGPGGDPGFSRFREVLCRFLHEEKDAAWLTAMARRLARLLSEQLFELRLGLESARLEQEERFRRRERLARDLAALGSRHVDRGTVARDRFRRLIAAEDDEFSRFETGALGRLRSVIEETAAGTVEATGRELDGRLRRAILEEADALLSEYLGDCRARFRKGLAEIARDLRTDTDAARKQAYEITATLFGVSAPREWEAPPLPEVDQASFEIDDVRCSLEEAVDFLLFRLPGPLARGPILRRAREAAWDLLNRNGGRIRHDLLTRGEKFLNEALEAAAREEPQLSERLLALLGLEAEPPAPTDALSHSADAIERALSLLEAA